MALIMPKLTDNHTITGEQDGDVGQESASKERGASSIAVPGCP